MDDLWFEKALLADGWASDVRISLAGGRISAIAADVRPVARDQRHAVALPGLPNLHSHAFQGAMAGRAEQAGGGEQDDFWSWRDRMYQLVGAIDPAAMEAIAAMAFVEMLESGFTRVGEFHYLHHQPSGEPYADPAEMAAAMASASADTGIALTLLPVLYAHSGFGGAPLDPRQRRFGHDIDGYAHLLDRFRELVRGLDGAVLGIAPHSLRAVTPDQLQALLAMAPSGPVHIHIAEQTGEVEACLAWAGQRPVAWLLDHMPVDPRWCLVHATHADTAELAAIARSGSVVGLCPVTEANLGDGIFPADEFLSAAGRVGIGSDSNVLIDAAEELRLLEYGQRLMRQRRNVLTTPGLSTGRSLFDAAYVGGSQALGVEATGLRIGASADLVVLARDDLPPVGDEAIDRWLFARGNRCIDSVWRAGRRVVTGGRHIARDRIAARYRTAMQRLHGVTLTRTV